MVRQHLDERVSSLSGCYIRERRGAEHRNDGRLLICSAPPQEADCNCKDTNYICNTRRNRRFFEKQLEKVASEEIFSIINLGIICLYEHHKVDGHGTGT